MTYEQKRDSDLQRLYGISLDRYHRMHRRQKGLCALCGEPPRGLDPGDILQVDHDHQTKKVRGLLCRPCNTFVGKIEKHRERLPRVLAYLEPSRRRSRRNSKGERGSVSEVRTTGRWRAQILDLGRRRQIGTYASEELARAALGELLPSES